MALVAAFVLLRPLPVVCLHLHKIGVDPTVPRCFTGASPFVCLAFADARHCFELCSTSFVMTNMPVWGSGTLLPCRSATNTPAQQQGVAASAAGIHRRSRLWYSHARLSQRLCKLRPWHRAATTCPTAHCTPLCSRLVHCASVIVAIVYRVHPARSTRAAPRAAGVKAAPSANIPPG